MKTIDIFPWDENFNTGLPTVDKQHKKLVKILNTLASHIAYSSSDKDLNAIFDELANYTVYHFETEESIWHQYLPDDPLDSDHQAVHQRFVDTVVKLKSEQATRPLIELAEEALGFLARWLASHILETDRHMAYIVFALEDGLDLDKAKVRADEAMTGSTRLLIDIILSIYETLSSNTLHLMRELKSHKNLEEKVDNQDLYRDLLLELSTDFINLPLDKVDDSINQALGKMANFVGADRSYIFDYNFDAQTTSNTYEWCGQGTMPQIEGLQGVPISFIPEWPDMHAKGEYILIQDVSALDEGPMRDILSPQGIQSLVTFPLFEDSKCIGFVGFDSVKVKHTFSPSEIAILELFSKLLSNVAERRHKESEQLNERTFLKTLVKTIPDLFWIKDMNGVYLSCNSRFEDFFGAKEADIVGKTDYDFVDKPLADFFRLNDKKVMQSAQINVNEETLSFANDGHKEIMQTTKVPMYDQEGKLNGVMGVARDITSIKEIQKELEIEKNRFALAVEGSQDGLWDWNLQTGEFLFGDRFEIMLGYIPGTLENTTNTWFNLIHPDDNEPANKVIQEYLDKKGEGVYENSFRLRAKDGSWKWMLGRGKAEFDKDGAPLRFVGFNTDITEKKVLEKKLEKSHTVLNELTKNVPGAIYQYRLYPDGRTTIPYISDGIKDLYEMSPDDLMHDATLSLKRVHQDDLEMLLFTVQDSAKNMKDWNIEYRVNLPKKGMRWVEGHAKPEKLEDGSILWHGFINDITEEKKKEEALILSNKRFEHAESVGNTGSWEYYIENQEYWGSHQAKVIYGADKDTTLFTAELVESCMPERKRIHQALVDLLEKGTPYNVEYEINPLDGSEPKIISSIGTLEYDVSNQPIKITGFIQDITEKKRILSLVEQKKKDLETIIQEAPNPMLLHIEGGKVLMLNQAWSNSSGFSFEEIQTIDDWINNTRDDEETIIFMKKHISSLYKITEKVDEGEFTFLNKNKKLVTWQVSSAPLGLIDSKQAIITSAMDITELKQKDEMLINQSRHAAMGEMIGMIAHQWRQPLSTISMDANNMLMDIKLGDFDASASQTYAESINQHTQHLSKTIDDFRNFFKPDKEILIVNIQDILNQSLSIIKDSLKNNTIELTSLFETEKQVEAYPREFMQVLVNVITNSKDALVQNKVENAQINVRVYEDEKYINTEISDNGGGIDAGILPKIFDPYFSTKDEKNGTGLGLYMSKMIVEDHLNGVIEMKNKNDGACLSIRLLKEGN